MNSIIQPVEDDIPSLERRDMFFAIVTKVVAFRLFFNEVTQNPDTGVWEYLPDGIQYDGSTEERSIRWAVIDPAKVPTKNNIVILRQHHRNEHLYEVLTTMTLNALTDETALCVTIITKEYSCVGNNLTMTPVTTIYNVVKCPPPPPV